VKKLIEAVGRPLLVTSANKSGEPTTKYFDDVVKAFGDELPAVVKGECESLTPTTIINLTADDKITLVREGPIPFEKILAYWEEQK
jgi:tRNA A37 threonylcarbamoyladenosine synthetase subunit TsaC/SUA5/YrdC